MTAETRAIEAGCSWGGGLLVHGEALLESYHKGQKTALENAKIIRGSKVRKKATKPLRKQAK